jgi:7-cyano-7-deazaguanine synthase
MKKMKNAIVLCSGGIDSSAAAYYVKKRLRYRKLIILFFDYGQRTLKQERKAARKIAKRLRAEFREIRVEELAKISASLINKSKVKKQELKVTRKELRDSKKQSEKYYVPCRNIVFLTYALALSESLQIRDKQAWDIFTGFKSEGKEAYPDTTKEFVDEINELKKVATTIKGKIKAPLIKLDKDEIILLGERLGVDFRNTYSCYISKEQHCGYCLACRLRQEAFYWANTKDPTKYKKKMDDYRRCGI